MPPLHRLLQTFNIHQQHYGALLEKGLWDSVVCGTFFKPVSEERAQRTFSVFAERLERHFKTKVAVFGALEHRYSGLGRSPIPRHWHLLICAPGVSRKLLNEAIKSIWESHYGNCHVQEFLPGGGAAYYMAKTARQQDFEWEEHRLEFAYPNGFEDIDCMDQENPFIPDHAFSMMRGETMRVWQPNELIGKQSRNTGGGYGRDR